MLKQYVVCGLFALSKLAPFPHIITISMTYFVVALDLSRKTLITVLEEIVGRTFANTNTHL